MWTSSSLPNFFPYLPHHPDALKSQRFRHFNTDLVISGYPGNGGMQSGFRPAFKIATDKLSPTPFPR